MAACSKDFLCGDESVAVSAICRSYSYGPNSSERVEKIVIDEKRLLQMLLVRYSLHSHNY